MKKCPYCAELIKSEAIKCRYCQSELSQLNELESDTTIAKEQNDERQVEPIHMEKTSENDFAEVRKKLKNAGNSASALGWLGLVAMVGSLIIGLIVPEFAFITLLIFAPVAIYVPVYIILGRRVSAGKDKNIGKYVNTLTIFFSVFTFISVIGMNGLAALLNILGLVYCIKARRALKTSRFESTLMEQQYSWNQREWITYYVGYVIIIGMFITIL